jgi:3-keto-5-aminohexanoate cleavage enzyme
MRKVIITAAVVGTRPTREMNPAVPYTPKEIAESAVECCRAGAASAHIHVRDPKSGSPEVKPAELQIELLKEVTDRIRERCSMIINLSASRVGLSEPNLIEKRLRPVALNPDVCSLHGEPEFFEVAAKKIREYSVKPEIELFDTKDIIQFLKYVQKGWFDEPINYQFNLGTTRGLDATPESLLSMKNELPEGAIWSAAVMDPSQQLSVLTIAMLLGANIRVGFEDNIYVKHGVLAKSNAQLVEVAVNLAHQLKYEIATPDEAREMLGIKK